MNELLHSLDWVLPLRSDQLTPLMLSLIHI